METTPARITIKRTEMPYNNTQSKQSNNTTSTLTLATPTPTNNSSKPTINLDMSPDNTYGKTLIRKCSANSRPQTSNSSLTQTPVEDYNEEYEVALVALTEIIFETSNSSSTQNPVEDYNKEYESQKRVKQINMNQQRTSSTPKLDVRPHRFQAYNKIENNNMIHNEYTLSKADQERALRIVEDNSAHIICSNTATTNGNGKHCIGQYIGREFVLQQNLRFLKENLAEDPSIANYDVEANFQKGIQDLNEIIENLKSLKTTEEKKLAELTQQDTENSIKEKKSKRDQLKDLLKQTTQKEETIKLSDEIKTLSIEISSLIAKVKQKNNERKDKKTNDISISLGKIAQHNADIAYYTNLLLNYTNDLEAYNNEEEKESLETKKKYFIKNCNYIVTKNNTSLSSVWEYEVGTPVLKELDTILPDGHSYKNNLSSELTTHRSNVKLQEGLTKISEKLKNYFNALANNPAIPNGFKIFIDTKHRTTDVATPDNIEIGLRPNQLNDGTIQWSLITCINDRTIVRDQDNDETVINLDCNPFYTGNGPNPKAADIYKQLFEQNTVTSKASKKRKKCKD